MHKDLHNDPGVPSVKDYGTAAKQCTVTSQGACPVLWLTGLSGAGKSTLAHALKRRLDARHVPAVVLDGDALRLGLTSDLGFRAPDRAENIRRVAEVARLFQQAGHTVIVALISPLIAHRAKARTIIGDHFVEVHVAASLRTCEARDPKGLYARARRGEIPDFTGIDSPYEIPLHADIAIDTGSLLLEDCVDLLFHHACVASAPIVTCQADHIA